MLLEILHPSVVNGTSIIFGKIDGSDPNLWWVELDSFEITPLENCMVIKVCEDASWVESDG